VGGWLRGNVYAASSDCVVVFKLAPKRPSSLEAFCEPEGLEGCVLLLQDLLQSEGARGPLYHRCTVAKNKMDCSTNLQNFSVTVRDALKLIATDCWTINACVLSNNGTEAVCQGLDPCEKDTAKQQ
jgi:hypothetical protein